MLDVRAGTMRDRPVIVVRGDRIESVSFGSKKTPRGATVIEHGELLDFAGTVITRVEKRVRGYRRAYFFSGFGLMEACFA